MKIPCLLALPIVLALPAAAQSVGAELDINNVRGPVYGTTGYLWNTAAQTSVGLEVPRVTDPSQPKRGTVFLASLWLGGLDDAGALCLAAETYRQGNPAQRGFWAGPMATQLPRAGDDPAYAFVWEVTRAQINDHRASYTTPGYLVPADLAAWPARPAGYTGISALAPFIDANGNGYYDPAGGDYPDVPGDQAIFFIANDAAGRKQPNTPPLKVEVQGMVYAFNPGTCDPALDNTVFVRYQLKNYSTTTYTDVYAGHYVDFDLGYYNDDYVGCDSVRQMGFAYNGDSFDEGVSGYGNFPPGQAVTVVGGEPLRGFQYYKNDNTIAGNPVAAADYYNYLRGRWHDNSLVQVGGNGLNGTTGPVTRWMYSGDPVASTGWTEGNTNGQGAANAPGDRRGLLTFGPFTFAPNETRTLELAYVTALAGVGALPAAVDAVRQCVTNGLLATRPDVRPAPAFTLTPNPARATVRLTLGSAPAAPQTVLVLDALGRVVREQMLRAVEATLELRGLAPGLYTVRVGAAARKLVVE